MSKIEVDTGNLMKCSQDFQKQVDNYNLMISNYFTTIKKIPSESQEWVGFAAESFIDSLNGVKDIYDEFGKSLEDYSELLSDCANLLIKATQKSQIN